VTAYNIANFKAKISESIDAGELKPLPKTIAQCISELDLLSEYMGYFIPMTWNKESGSGKNAYDGKPIGKRVVFGYIYTFQDFLTYVDTKSDLRKNYHVGFDSKGNKVSSYSGLKVF
jgi:hypothetical protein